MEHTENCLRYGKSVGCPVCDEINKRNINSLYTGLVDTLSNIHDIKPTFGRFAKRN